MITNKVLLRQLKKSKIKDFDNVTPEQFNKLLSFIESSYKEIDDNTYRLERALQISTEELREFNDTLEEKVKLEIEKNREKERQLIEQSRFAALGEMIGNIAHQWRQPLSAISSTASGMKLQIELGLATDEEIKKSYSSIINYVSFLTQTIEDFRGFFKKDKVLVEFNIIDTIKQTLSIVSASYKDNNIKLNYDFKDTVLLAKGIPSELSQVFLNILNNAKDAMVSNNIENKLVYIGYKQEDEANTIFIQDNAGGISEDIIKKVFDPYFTTKHQSQGTGIGLYMSKDIVEKNMNGLLSVKNMSITINSINYNGAQFNIKIPAI